MCLDLVLQIGSRMKSRSLCDQHPTLIATNPPFYTYSSETIIRFLLANIEKFAYGFEYSLIKDGGKSISPQSTKLGLMFLRLLRACYRGYPLQRTSDLWIDIGKQIPDKPTAQGIGLKISLSMQGYGYILPNKVNWAMWQFRPDIENIILFKISALEGTYSKQYQNIATTRNFHGHCYELIEWLASSFKVLYPDVYIP